MSHYKSNLRDLRFNLFEANRVQDRLGVAPFDALDEDTAREVIAEVDRLARGPLAASFVDGDRNPPVLEPGSSDITLPASITASVQAVYDGEWHRLNLPAHMGGFGAPPSIQWACAELILGANPAVFLYALTGSSFSAILDAIGNDDQKRLAAAAIEKLWGATMVLTEPDAGSDVGAGRTKAVEQPDGTWHIEGVKRFITSGDWDLPENILHWVLARPEGARAGTKGLSLFIVPKFRFDWTTFALGERNGAHVTNLEHKMGLKASTTCELTLGERAPAVGYLVGDVHDGIAQMFMVIEQARMMVGTKSIATLSTGYLNALEYATTRRQGSDLADSRGSAAPRVPIVRHPDVRRSLMIQKAYAEGMRALYLYTCGWQDEIRLAGARGERDEMAVRINDLLLPIVKGFGSERSYALLSAESLQTFGGSGYLRDYPIEQYIRDSKIDTLYEGTTAIQGQDLFFRKIVRDRGRALGAVSRQIQGFLGSEAGNGRLKDERALLAVALGDVQAMVGTLIGWTTTAPSHPGNIYKVGQNTSRLLMALGDLLTGWLLLRHAQIALDALDRAASDNDRAFYEGKIASARFFAAQVLPRLSMDRAVLEATDDSLMDVPDESF
ncbi:MAG: acyl-CoA dehydrogenase C-terminal domain-containing protein [Geodermatophilaceae bacterium]|nr:acyl-CoA dehydrogenase C-terminal domain-containing protein [Geodermatophilaceae bacterium]